MYYIYYTIHTIYITNLVFTYIFILDLHILYLYIYYIQSNKSGNTQKKLDDINQDILNLIGKETNKIRNKKKLEKMEI